MYCFGDTRVCIHSGVADRGIYGTQNSDHEISYNTVLFVAKRVSVVC